MAVNNFSGTTVNSLFAAGKNKILNGDFGIWQRGTSFTIAAPYYTADRWKTESGAAATITRQSFSPGAAPVAGYEGSHFLRYSADVAAGVHGIDQMIEDVRTFAGQTVTLSFWMKSAASTTGTMIVDQVFGSGGSATVGNLYQNFAVTTSWQRFTFTFNLASLGGKTIGANSYLWLRFLNLTNTTHTFDIWGVQLEAGSVATPFTTATGNPASELAACQRYYVRLGSEGGSAYTLFAMGTANSATQADILVNVPTTLRAAPTSVDYANLSLLNHYNTAGLAVTGMSLSYSSAARFCVRPTVASGLTAGTAYNLAAANSTNAYIGFSAEL